MERKSWNIFFPTTVQLFNEREYTGVLLLTKSTLRQKASIAASGALI